MSNEPLPNHVLEEFELPDLKGMIKGTVDAIWIVPIGHDSEYLHFSLLGVDRLESKLASLLPHTDRIKRSM